MLTVLLPLGRANTAWTTPTSVIRFGHLKVPISVPLLVTEPTLNKSRTFAAFSDLVTNPLYSTVRISRVDVVTKLALAAGAAF
jgi:hypothetical protein